MDVNLNDVAVVDKNEGVADLVEIGLKLFRGAQLLLLGTVDEKFGAISELDVVRVEAGDVGLGPFAFSVSGSALSTMTPSHSTDTMPSSMRTYPLPPESTTPAALSTGAYPAFFQAYSLPI